jgi:hypothetical protein
LPALPPEDETERAGNRRPLAALERRIIRLQLDFAAAILLSSLPPLSLLHTHPELGFTLVRGASAEIMPEKRVTIAQISDLHMNRKVKRAVTDMLLQILKQIRPDILVVSGDLANQPVPWQMKKAARFVREIKDVCHPARVIVIPGNHDVKFWGMLASGGSPVSRLKSPSGGLTSTTHRWHADSRPRPSWRPMPCGGRGNRCASQPL